MLGNFPKNIRHLSFLGWFVLLLSSCNSIKSSVLFESEESINPEAFKQTLYSAYKSYTIQKFDVLAISLFPNNAEPIVDPTDEFPIGEGGIKESAGAGGGGQMQLNPWLYMLDFPISSNGQQPQSYVVNSEGKVKLPNIGFAKLEGLTLEEANSLLSKKYSGYMKDPYVVTQYLNKKVILMGALGDRVLPMKYENMTLYEVLGLASTQGQATGVEGLRNAKINDIRIIRNHSTEEFSLLKVDISTAEGARKLMTRIEPNDLIYIEPRRNFDRSLVSDISSIISPFATVLAIIITIVSLNNSN